MSPVDPALIAQTASGSIVAQEVVEAVRATEIAWLKFFELTAKHGRHSTAAGAFIVELARRATL